jgi:hypothetical protein
MRVIRRRIVVAADEKQGNAERWLAITLGGSGIKE